MIEIPRAALTADEVAKHADFFSFGTNDLTQMTFGYSRDDVGSFLPQYVEDGILEYDPFAVLDQTGVGQLVRIGTERGRSTKKDLKVGSAVSTVVSRSRWSSATRRVSTTSVVRPSAFRSRGSRQHRRFSRIADPKRALPPGSAC
jgi:phosphoenolpyruvate synthase/pyruvate phosphate dikinase